MCCIKWRKTYQKTVTQSPGQLEYLAQVTYSKGIWVEISIETGQDTPQSGGGATWTVPIRQDLDTNDSWKIVRPDSETPTGRLQLEVKVANDVARFRLINLDSIITLKWINVTLEVNGQDNPTIQELTGVGQSNTTDFYLPDDSSAEPWIALIQAEAAERLAKDNLLASQLQTEITTRQATVDAETQGRIAAVAAANAALAQEIIDRGNGDTTEAAARVAGDATTYANAIQRANHTGTQLAATISDIVATIRAQVEAELIAGSNITITPAGVGATRTLTLASSGGGGGSTFKRWDPDKPPAVANALDVEFASNPAISAWPAGWTAAGGGDFQNPIFPNVEAGRFSTWHNAAGWKGRQAACPAAGTDFSLAARLANSGSNANFNIVAISLGNATTIESGTAWHNFMVGYNTSMAAAPSIGIEQNGFTMLVNYGPQVIALGVVVWMRRVGTNYFYGWSYDGQHGVETGPHTLGSSPTVMLVGSYNDRGEVASEIIYWVRHVSGAGMGARRSWGGLREIYVV